MGIILQFARPSDVRGGTATTANLCQRFDTTLVANRFELKRRCNKEVIMASTQVVADRGGGAIETPTCELVGTLVLWLEIH